MLLYLVLLNTPNKPISIPAGGLSVDEWSKAELCCVEDWKSAEVDTQLPPSAYIPPLGLD